MTVNDFKETSCASAGKVKDLMRLEVKYDDGGATPVVPTPECGENLLGKVLEGKKNQNK